MIRVAITGASGSMGHATYQELMKQNDKYDISMLVRPSKKNIRMFKTHIPSSKSPKMGEVTEKEGVKIVWGVVQSFKHIRQLVEDSDVVINMAAIIPPRALKSKRDTEDVNIGGVKNILAAIKAIPGGSRRIRFIAISSVAVYGDRLPPYHSIQIGDPVYPSIGDFYALTKIHLERLIIESGLRYWAVIRQTFITIPNLFSLMDPLMYMQPIQQCIEPITWRDAGFGMVNCIDAPESFWRNIYNCSGGKDYRVVYHEFLQKMFGIFGLNFYKCVDRNWFALRNFHCGWFSEADNNRLNQYSRHVRDNFETYFEAVKAATPKILGLAKFAPSPLVRVFMRLYAVPLTWVKYPNRYPKLVSSFFGSRKRWNEISDWNSNMPVVDGVKKIELGYEWKEGGDYSIGDMQALATFRGGEALSSEFIDMYTPLGWKCNICDCEFEATPMLVTNGGHWCPGCESPIWNYDEIAKKNHFIGQVHYNTHDEDENEVYTTAELLSERKMKD